LEYVRVRGGLDTGGLLSRGVMGVVGSDSSYFGAGLRVTRDPDGVRAKSPVCDATIELVCPVSDANGSPSLGSPRGGALALELNTFRSYDVRPFTCDSSGTDALEVELRVRPVTPAPPTDADAEALRCG